MEQRIFLLFVIFTITRDAEVPREKTERSTRAARCVRPVGQIETFDPRRENVRAKRQRKIGEVKEEKKTYAHIGGETISTCYRPFFPHTIKLLLFIYELFFLACVTRFFPSRHVHTSTLFSGIIHREKIPIKITVVAQYSCSIFIFLFILHCRIVKNMVLRIKFYISLCKFHRAAR